MFNYHLSTIIQKKKNMHQRDFFKSLIKINQLYLDQPDSKAIKFISFKFIKKLKKLKSFTTQDSFLRWKVCSNKFLLHQAIMKLTLCSKISYPIAIYRFKWLILQKKLNKNGSLLSVHAPVTKAVDILNK